MTDADPGDRRGAARPRPNGRIALGLLLIGTGRAAGFTQFGATRDAYLASLAPWLGIQIVLAGLLGWTGHLSVGLSFFFIAICNLLAPAVIAELLCGAWRRQECWAHYANVLNCLQWLTLCAFVVLLPAASLLVQQGLPIGAAARLLLAVVLAYVAWLHWFAARHALQISRRRAVVAMLCVLFGTALLLQIPDLVTGGGALLRFGR